jgi:hypothetical protein
VKFDDQLAQYLYQNKLLKLEGIGTFTLDGKVSLPGEHEKEIYYPIEGLAFNYNPKEVLDEDLVAFLVKRLGKIQPLVRSDLDSYISNIRQFINLGKPYTIEGIGTLSKNNKGTFEFTPGNFLPAKEELNPKRENAEHNYPPSSKGSAGKLFAIILIIIASLAALGGIGWGVSTFFAKNTNDESSENQVQQGQLDTIPQQQSIEAQPAIDTPLNTTSTTTAIDTTNIAGYKMIFEITPNPQRAISRKEKLKDNGVNFDTVTREGVPTFRLYVPMQIRPQDTVRAKDSLRKWYARRIVIDKL